MSQTNLDDILDLSDPLQVEWYDEVVGLSLRVDHPYLNENQEVISMLEQAEEEYEHRN